ncbi:hypothetical protein Poli38472_009261 [Pythium oligandrum]|uniref:ER membrane protein complex subunit 4 n=1 Tax=Pythium oligandrum TaxID=41045 RepID=A0A8K1CK97_PYTOL|nr:hypothetical protein Poli38472_009261 [Pythium oligandrum]|eukprot:TMW65094.1 hypothetical protein Poli38472_009261 [Pythium oligandrum]
MATTETRGKWRVEFNEARESDLPTRLEPVGYCRGITADKNTSTAVAKQEGETLELKKKRAMEIGTAPFKSLMQTGLMMWMSGSQINIFSIMITGMIVMNTIKSIFGMQAAFTSVAGSNVDLTQPKLVYLLGNIVNAGMALYKCANMGLLPTTSADWTWLLPIRQAVESSSFAYST